MATTVVDKYGADSTYRRRNLAAEHPQINRLEHRNVKRKEKRHHDKQHSESWVRVAVGRNRQ